MTTYLRFARNAFSANAAYRFDSVFQGIGRLIRVVVQIAVWAALYRFTEVKQLGDVAVSLQDMIYYTIVSALITALADNEVIYEIDGKIKTGEIAADFIKPVSFQAYMLSTMLGKSLYSLVFRFAPMALVLIPIFGLYLPDWRTVLIFIPSLLCSVLISFLLSFILGLVGFWYLNIWHIERFLSDFTRLFSGSFVPLWFFPDVLNTISLFLPFRFIYFVPISIFLEKVSLSQAGLYLLEQLLWIAGLFLLSRIVWKRGIRRLVIQGG